MKKLLLSTLFVVTFFAVSTVSASASANGVVRVGLRYSSTALLSANLENAVGEGYEFGYYDGDRTFVPLGETEETAISMTAAGDIYMSESGVYSRDIPSGGYRSLEGWHVQLDGTYRDFEQAASAARACGGWPAWIDGEYVVRTGCYGSRSQAENDAGGLAGRAVRSADTGVIVTVTKSNDILFEFDGSGDQYLGVRPVSWGKGTETWFKGYRYAGGFEYRRTGGGDLSVINVVDLEDYVKGVLPTEMGGGWPLEALKAQAVCARTYASRTTKHQNAGFDVCAATHCQMYTGRNAATDTTDEAVDRTAGKCLWYGGELIDAVYHACDGGATEDASNVWGGGVPYLKGKLDPYEAQTSIPGYSYTVTYTAEELTWILQNSGRSIGTVADVYVSQRTALGNVYAVTFVDTSGKKLTLTGDNARMAFYSTTYGKSVPSLRFEINGGSGGGSGGAYCVNGSGTKLDSLEGVTAISGSGQLATLEGGKLAAVTSGGTETVSAGTSGRKSAKRADGTFTITGTGNGHNVGMSQYGAKAMAEQGHDYEDILDFYYTDVTIR